MPPACRPGAPCWLLLLLRSQVLTFAVLPCPIWRSGRPPDRPDRFRLPNSSQCWVSGCCRSSRRGTRSSCYRPVRSSRSRQRSRPLPRCSAGRTARHGDDGQTRQWDEPGGVELCAAVGIRMFPSQRVRRGRGRPTVGSTMVVGGAALTDVHVCGAGRGLKRLYLSRFRSRLFATNLMEAQRKPLASPRVRWPACRGPPGLTSWRGIRRRPRYCAA
jgi:hypothetical protein